MRDNFETIKLERRGDHLLIVTLNRPKAGNSMNFDFKLGRSRITTFVAIATVWFDESCSEFKSYEFPPLSA